MAASKTPSPSAERPVLRVLLVDADTRRRASYREAVEIAGFSEPETAATADEALDILGAQAQRFDVVAAWMPLPDDADVDLAGVLRRCQSPVRLLVMTTKGPSNYPRAGRLAGASGIAGNGGEREFIQLVRALVATPGTSVAEITADHRVPPTLSDAWATRIYGVPPGARFLGKLD